MNPLPLCATQEYFPDLLKSSNEDKIYALHLLIEDLYTNKDATVMKLLVHPGFVDFLYALQKLLSFKDEKVAGNAAYVIGTIADSEYGSLRLINTLSVLRDSELDNEYQKLIGLLFRMLNLKDVETVMNATGTLGSLCETPEGRQWFIQFSSFNDLLSAIGDLLASSNQWTCSNAALILARLAIDDEGRYKIQHHHNVSKIIQHLIHALGVDETGLGMNAAFALGRLCDNKDGKQLVLTGNNPEKLLSRLLDMLQCKDMGMNKNACYCLNCVAQCDIGHDTLLSNTNINKITSCLLTLLANVDLETAWFAATAIKSLVSKPRGCIYIKHSRPAMHQLHETFTNPSLTEELKTVIEEIFEFLQAPPQPHAPIATVLGPRTILLQWETVSLKSGFTMTYRLFRNSVQVYRGMETQYEDTQLTPFTEYAYQVKACTDVDEGLPSDKCLAVTEESTPEEPSNVHLLIASTSQLKIAWEPPHQPNGILKMYFIYLENKLVDQTSEQSTIISGLYPSTTYTVFIAASTCKGKGSKAKLIASTLDLGSHAPAKPVLSATGRSEILVNWEPPENPLGRINRYEVLLNGSKLIYSGQNLFCRARNLNANTEYTISVIVLTGEGRFESEPSKKRTWKDDYSNLNRAPLYTTPPKPLARENSTTDSNKLSYKLAMRRSSSPSNLVSSFHQIKEFAPDKAESSSNTKNSSAQSPPKSVASRRSTISQPRDVLPLAIAGDFSQDIEMRVPDKEPMSLLNRNRRSSLIRSKTHFPMGRKERTLSQGNNSAISELFSTESSSTLPGSVFKNDTHLNKVEWKQEREYSSSEILNDRTFPSNESRVFGSLLYPGTFNTDFVEEESNYHNYQYSSRKYVPHSTTLRYKLDRRLSDLSSSQLKRHSLYSNADFNTRSSLDNREDSGAQFSRFPKLNNISNFPKSDTQMTLVTPTWDYRASLSSCKEERE